MSDRELGDGAWTRRVDNMFGRPRDRAQLPDRVRRLRQRPQPGPLTRWIDGDAARRER